MNVVASVLGCDRISASAGQSRVMVVEDPGFLGEGPAGPGNNRLDVVVYANRVTGLGVADERGPDVGVHVPQRVRGTVTFQPGGGHEIAVRVVRDRMM